MSIFTDHFQSVDDQIGPQPWMQLRCVASEQAESVSKSYDVSDGWGKDDLALAVQAEWTNTTPMTQYVYGLVTKSGSQVTLQCRSRGYLSTGHAIDVTSGTPSPSVIEVSRFGIGSDVGKGGILAIGGAYGISELRQNSTTTMLMPHLTGWFPVEPGETFAGRVEVKFISEFWENTMIDGGDGDTESKFVTGDYRLDLFAIPMVTEAPPRLTPTIVGASSDSSTNLIFWDTHLNPDVPAGVAEGDVLIALVAAKGGKASDISAVEAGWQVMHEQDAGTLDSHLKIFIRTADASEPSNYAFNYGWLADGAASIVALRNAVPYDSADGNLHWRAASTVSKYQKLNKKQAITLVTGSAPDPTCPTLFTATGTSGSTVETLIGAPTGLADVMVGLGVEASLWNWRPIHYRGDTMTGDAFFHMDRTAADGTQKMMAAIEATPGAFALSGLSQGAIVCSNVYDAIRTGDLQHRQADFLGGVMFGNPRRQTGFTIPGGFDPGSGTHHGIMRDSLLVNCNPNLWWEFVNTGDLVADVDDSATGLAKSEMFEFMLGNYGGQGTILTEAWAALNGLLGGMSQATMEGWITAYADTMKLAIEWLYDLLMGLLGGPETAAVGAHLTYHEEYENLADNTKSAVQLAIEHLNAVSTTYRAGAPINLEREAWVGPIPGSPYGVKAPAAPSITGDGQLLLALSFLAHIPFQGTISHTPPYGMSELVDAAEKHTSFSVAALTSPPNPTRDRVFTLGEFPQSLSRAITASILVPGALDESSV